MGLYGGALGQLTGSSIDFGSVSSKKLLKNLFGPGVTANALLSMFSNPEILQLFSVTSAMGMDPFAELAKFTVNKKDIEGGLKNAPPGQYVKIGKGKFVNTGAVATSQPEYNSQLEDFKIAEAEASLEKVKATPAFATIAAMSEGKFDDDFLAVVNNEIDQQIAEKFGAAGAQGMLHDPSKTGKAIADASVAKASFLTEKKLEAENILKAAAGFGGALSYAPGGIGGPTTPGSFIGPFSNLGWNSAQLASQLAQFNAQGGFAETQAKAQAMQDFFGTLVGAAGGMYSNQNMNSLLASMSKGGGGGGWV